jgi:glutathione synthase
MRDKSFRLGIVMDPIENIVPKKDSSLAMLLEAERRNYEIHYMLQSDLKLLAGKAIAQTTILSVEDNLEKWYKFGEQQQVNLDELDVILMRKDPPFDMEYIYTTYILERAEIDGALIVNKPSSLRDMNEKIYTAWFSDCSPLTLVTRSMNEMRQFVKTHKKIVIKPLDGMGGKSIFVVKHTDKNTNVIIETLTDYGKKFAMAQIYIPEIKEGDKRILLIDGEPIPYCLARIPSTQDNRGNLVTGARGKGKKLTDQDIRICKKIGPVLKENGIVFCGIDVIGDYLTEINSTSPTGIKELDRNFNLNISGMLFDEIEKKLA